MKFLSLALALCASVMVGCAHGPQAVSAPVPGGETRPRHRPWPPIRWSSILHPFNWPRTRQPRPRPPDEPEEKSEGDEDDFDYGMEDVPTAEQVTIADPWEPFNRAMFTFNDRLYFWVLKPVAEGYSAVLPEPARVSVGNFFSNLRSPIRLVNCLLQANFIGAATELFRFMLNSTIGLAGLFDPAGGEEIGLVRQDEDFGQTLGSYGVGQGFYIVWPFLGPSSPRDTVGMIGDYFSYPISYLDPWYVWIGRPGVPGDQRHLSFDRRLRGDQGSRHRSLPVRPQCLHPVPAEKGRGEGRDDPAARPGHPRCRHPGTRRRTGGCSAAVKSGEVTEG